MSEHIFDKPEQPLIDAIKAVSEAINIEESNRRKRKANPALYDNEEPATE